MGCANDGSDCRELRRAAARDVHTGARSFRTIRAARSKSPFADSKCHSIRAELCDSRARSATVAHVEGFIVATKSDPMIARVFFGFALLSVIGCLQPTDTGIS